MNIPIHPVSFKLFNVLKRISFISNSMRKFGKTIIIFNLSQPSSIRQIKYKHCENNLPIEVEHTEIVLYCSCRCTAIP